MLTSWDGDQLQKLFEVRNRVLYLEDSWKGLWCWAVAGKDGGGVQTGLRFCVPAHVLGKWHLRFTNHILRQSVAPNCFNKTHCIVETSWAQRFVTANEFGGLWMACSCKVDLLHFRIPTYEMLLFANSVALFYLTLLSSADVGPPPLSLLCHWFQVLRKQFQTIQGKFAWKWYRHWYF